MNNQVSDILIKLITENGTNLCTNRVKLQGLLFDLCGESKKEINILITILQHNIVQEILNISENSIDNLTYRRLVNRVCEEASTDKKATSWAIKSWINAVGKVVSETSHSKSSSNINLVKANTPIYLDNLYISRFNESILKRYSFENVEEHVARIENIQSVAFGKAKLINPSYDVEEVIFSLEVNWDRWLKTKGIINYSWNLSIKVDRTIATSLYNSSEEFCVNGKLKVVNEAIMIKEARINALGTVFDINFSVSEEEVKEVWTYYSDEADGYKIYKMKADGTCKLKLNEDRSLNMNIIGDWIYYCNGSDYFKIYKMKLDGSNKSIVSEDLTGNIKVRGDWIYYLNYLDDRKMYKIKIDGTNKCKANNEELPLLEDNI